MSDNIETLDSFGPDWLNNKLKNIDACQKQAFQQFLLGKAMTTDVHSGLECRKDKSLQQMPE